MASKNPHTEIVNGHEIEILFSRNGFGIEFRAYTDRPYAVEVDGRILRTAGGAKRTFASKAAALTAARRRALTLPAGDFGTRPDTYAETEFAHPCA